MNTGAPPTASAVFAPGLLAGHVALITGGGTGLGRASALELARCGATVVIAGRRREVLQQATEEVAAAAGERARADFVTGDIRDPAEAEGLVATVLERHGRLDTLVNNAGDQYFVPAEAIADKGWQAVWRLNVNGTLQMCRAALDQAMIAARSGMIVNITLSPHHGMPGMAHSGSARAAVEALTTELAREGGAHGVAVTAVAAGHFDTEAVGKYPESVRAGAARSVPLGRLGEEQEHAWLIALLASALGRALSGSVITLDGARDNWFGPWPPLTLVDSPVACPPRRARRPAEAAAERLAAAAVRWGRLAGEVLWLHRSLPSF